MNEWEELYKAVYHDVDWDNCSRSTQRNLKKLNEIYKKTSLENCILKNEVLRLFDRLCEIVEMTNKFDINYLDNWLKEQMEK